jgi:eukaryotic-like serine/threonine-protein kinase
MAVQSNHCDRDRLRLLTEDRLAPDELGHLERHVHECPECQAELERLANADHWIGAAKKYLGDETLSQVVDPNAPVDTSLDFLAPSDWPDSLGRIGTYEVKGVVGRGGMAVVLKAVDPALNRTVAIKVLATHLAASGAARQRFVREAQAAAAVMHENVVAVHSVNEANGLPYLVMEYVPGGSLQDRLDRQGPLPIPVVLRIGMQAAAGLAVAHGQGLVHRDVKPANILLDVGVERARLTDFGLARAGADAQLTQSGVVTGTPHYMAPEQARAEAVDHRSDLFSLGSTLYAMCAGYPPFRAESAVAILRRVSDDEPRPLREINTNVPDWLEAIIARLHAKDANQRYQSAAEVAELLGRCLAHLQQPLTVSLPSALLQKRESRRRFGRSKRWIAAAVVLVSVAVLLLAFPRRQHPDVNIAKQSSEAPPSKPPQQEPVNTGKRQKPDEIDEQLQALRQRARTVEVGLEGSDASNSRDYTSEQIRNALIQAQMLEQQMKTSANGASR